MIASERNPNLNSINHLNFRPLTHGRFVIALAAWLVPSIGFATGGDNFNDNAKNPSNWGADVVSGHGVLTEKNQRLEYTCANPTGQDGVDRAWILTRFPCNADWEMQIDTLNVTVPFTGFDVSSFGFLLLSPNSADNNLFVEFYSSSLGFPGSWRTGFAAELETNDQDVGIVDAAGGQGITNGAIRLTFTGATKVLTVFYDADASDVYQWVDFGSFGLAGSGGLNGDTDWSLGASDQFSLYVYGYSEGMVITSGQVYGDNFSEIGGVNPSNAPAPVPTGTFKFLFPSSGLLTRILSVSGNYTGVTPTSFNRNYNVDVAQDESGKLMAMGTMDGMLNESGGPEVSGSIGAVKTVNNEPVAQLKGSFKGTRDGVNTTASGTATSPLEVVDVDGDPGFGGTGSYKANVGGIPFSGKNLPVQMKATVDNVKSEWSIELDIDKKVVKGKEVTVGSGELVLPNGDLIVFPERVIKYSAQNGYSLSLKAGTNVTALPNHIDRKTSVTIKGLTFEQQEDDWMPTGGTIQYKFLGQKGAANLMDFSMP
jgi:hypothetical protein